MKKTEVIVEETQRESIINRPHNLAGSVKHISKERFNITEDSIVYREANVVPALLKVFMEALDNPIDVAIKGGCSKIDINVTNDYIEVKDNGYGVSTEEIDGESVVYKAFCKYNTSSNYGDNRGQGQKGVNGIGVKLCTTLSTKMEVTSEDAKGKVKLTATENNLNHQVKTMTPTGKTGVKVRFYPDFNIFDGDGIDDEHIKRMFEYTLIQAMTYQDIKFTFNSKKINYTPKKFISLLNEFHVIENNDDYFLAFLPNEFDDFKQMSFVNGLETSKGGTHVDYVVNNVVTRLREKLLKKYKTIKPADIKNKLTFVLVSKNVKQIDWDGQTKESITTPNKAWIEYFKDVNFDALAQKIFKKQEIIEPITEVYRIKEEFKLRQELKKTEKPEKSKIKDKKFLPPIGKWKRIFLAEGDSASNSLSKILGRQDKGFYAMFGVPPNAYDMDISEIVDSDKLKSLRSILGLKYSQDYQNSIKFDEIIIATDADLPGFFIRGQLLGLFTRFAKNLFDEGKIKILRTPVIVGYDSNEAIIEWFYDAKELQDFEKANPKTKLVFEWKKGLASWDPEELQFIIEKEGLETMLETMVFDENAEENIKNWLSSKMANKRKEMLDGFEFDIVNL